MLELAGEEDWRKLLAREESVASRTDKSVNCIQNNVCAMVME
jgi:hypothetical protein